MAPEIWIGKNLIASVPDETGKHKMLSGKPLYVNVDAIDASKTEYEQRILLDTEEIGGKRMLRLSFDGTREGKGSKIKGKPPIRVVLLERPICEISSDVPNYWSYGQPADDRPEKTFLNPRWVKNRG